MMNTPLPANRFSAFDALYEQRLLGEYETVSGKGGTLMETRNLRRGLTAFFTAGVFRSVLDVGCGDANWAAALELSGVDYLGIDIVDEALAEARRKYPHRVYEVLDIVTAVPPAHDLILCHDLFSHFNYADTVSAFNNIKKSGSGYMAATGFYPEAMNESKRDFFLDKQNKNTPTGYWRSSNFCRPPFSFRKPLWQIPENRAGKTLDIWRLDDMPFLEVEALLHPQTDNPQTPEDFQEYEFFRKLCALPFIKKIELFGSRAIGKQRDDSDIDLMIHCRPETTRRQWLEVCEIVRLKDTPLGVDCLRYEESVRSIMDKWPPDLKTLYEAR